MPIPASASGERSEAKVWKSPCIASLTLPSLPLSPTFAPVSRALASGVTSCTPESAETSAIMPELISEPVPMTRSARSGESAPGVGIDAERRGDLAQDVARNLRPDIPEIGQVGSGLFGQPQLDELGRLGGVALQQLDRRLQAGLVSDELVDARRKRFEEEAAAAVGEHLVQRLFDQLIGVDAGVGHRRLIGGRPVPRAQAPRRAAGRTSARSVSVAKIAGARRWEKMGKRPIAPPI